MCSGKALQAVPVALTAELRVDTSDLSLWRTDVLVVSVTDAASGAADLGDGTYLHASCCMLNAAGDVLLVAVSERIDLQQPGDCAPPARCDTEQGTEQGERLQWTFKAAYSNHYQHHQHHHQHSAPPSTSPLADAKCGRLGIHLSEAKAAAEPSHSATAAAALLLLRLGSSAGARRQQAQGQGRAIQKEVGVGGRGY
ncbi:hypothetical protein DM02DRAFT_651467 [Periconia macrospinosa]|uniref:Uncharacterized protein n=1 Tax=Periconia macrospinosa TaxID=97972 RepID=A0A2V1E2H1_9PLEO|nr:hypothetical protein DM02DRAFT_651467 [Periconia macrospinosa]